jgi:hypothetical protein
MSTNSLPEDQHSSDGIAKTTMDQQEIKAHFETAYNLICNLHDGAGSSLANDVFLCQSTLGKAIHKIESERLKTSQELNAIRRNRRVDNSEHSLSIKIRDFDELINIGRGIGDLYVWIFLRFDREYVKRNLKMKPIRMSPYWGGFAEIRVVEELTGNSGNIAILNSISNILRIGDITFYNLYEKKACGVGEIKSKKIDEGKAESKIHILVNRQNYGSWKFTPSTKTDAMQTDEWQYKDRLDRQLQNITSAFNEKKLEPHLSQTINAENHSIELNFVRFIQGLEYGKWTSHVISDGIGVMGYRFKSQIFDKGNRATEEAESHRMISSIQADQFISDLFPTGKTDRNTIVIDSLYYMNNGNSYTAYSLLQPLFYRIHNHNVVKDIIFKNVHVIVFVNREYLYREIEKLGCNIEFTDINKDSAPRSGVSP